ncbi:hypothetical protein E4T50_10111 [Aureobasidium sp. EXF-12298]|nr:hypothetical protein E4T50_10111 [Aureobasidium sp. EXF-12298]KAI4757813.1 hypothetical protein E4T51_09127 [Aureobasidium sp. EXF-12344]KAI4778201.1 hypothetical protein E4T52_06880 [Aureobasidium sp. EXF-3400]
MALPGIEGFKNVYEILEAVSAGDKVRLRRAARKIRLVLMCADDTCLSEEHRACLTAILGLLVTDWDEAEKLRLEAAQSYLHVRAKAALCCENAIARVENKLRHLLLEELNGKQNKYTPPGKTLKSIKVRNEREAKQNLQELGLEFRYPLLKKYPERAFAHSALKDVLEGRALEQKFNGFVEVEDADLLDFLFDGYFEALSAHHKMDALNDFDPDIDEAPIATFSKTETSTTVSQPKILSSEEAERKRVKNKKRNLRKRVAEKAKKKENVASTSAPEVEANAEPKVKLESSMALIKISSSSESPSSDNDALPKIKFVPQPKDKVWMRHPCLSSEECNDFFTQLQEAMLRVPTANLERRVYGSQT